MFSSVLGLMSVDMKFFNSARNNVIVTCYCCLVIVLLDLVHSHPQMFSCKHVASTSSK